MTNTVNDNKVATQKIVEIFNTGDLSEEASLSGTPQESGAPLSLTPQDMRGRAVCFLRE